MPFLPPTPKVASNIQAISWQENAIQDIVDKLATTHKGSKRRGVLLCGGTGLGKMYIKAGAVCELLKRGLLVAPEGSINPFPVLWLCPKSVKTQTQRVLKDYGIAHLVMLYSYGQIKNSDGTDTFIQYITGPDEEIIPVWLPHMAPAAIVADECQVLKNPSSLQSKVVRYAPEATLRIFASATPFQRVSDAQTVIEGVGAITKYNALPCTMNTSGAILRNIAAPQHPDKYSPSAVKRLRDELEPYIVELKGVRFKHPTKTTQSVIQFRTPQARREYEDAYNEYVREVAEGRRKGKSNHGNIAILVAMQKFKEKASLLRADEIAERAVKQISNGKQIIIGADYISTLRAVWNFLVKVHNVDRNRITFVVGGQSEKLRQENIDKFQAGDSDIMLITVRSGGVGISLHHDRPSSRPRYVIVPPTWSAIDLVQYLGRAHRLTSISPTEQEVLWYADTIESDRVMPYVKNKVKCLSKAITAKEQFITMFEKAAGEDIDDDINDEYNEMIEENKESVEQSEDDHVEEISGEGLDSVDELPTSYK